MQNFLRNLASKSAVSFQESTVGGGMVVPVEDIISEKGPYLSQLKDYCQRNRKKFSYAGIL